MSSYINKKSRVFTSPGSTKVIQKRSESRLKNIKSATDNRAWTDCVEDRRQYILELIKSKAGGLSLGKYIPIEVIIDCLLANKNAQIEELQRQLDAYKKLKLTDDQLKQLGILSPGGDKKVQPPPKTTPPKEEPKPVEKKEESPKVEPPKPEPTKVDPPKPEPSKVESNKEELKPSEVEPAKAGLPTEEPKPVVEEKPEPTVPPKEEKPETSIALKEKTPVPSLKELEVPETPIASKKGPDGEEDDKKGTDAGDKTPFDKVSQTVPKTSGHAIGEEDRPPEKPKDITDPTDLPLRSEFQKIVVGDVVPGEGETDKDRASRNGSLKQKFVDIAETMDEDLEKGAKEALSPKKETSEDKDKDDVISSLQKQLEDQKKANELAQRALKQLEEIDQILSTSTKLRCNLTCKNACQPCPTMVKKMNDMDNKKQRLEDLMKERDELRSKVSDLEKQLGGTADKTDKELCGIATDELQKRLDQVIGLESKVQELVNQLKDEEDSGKLKEQKQGPKDTDKLKAKIAELEKEMEKSKFLKVENAKLQMKIQELLHVEKSQDELKKKIGSMEGEYKEKYDGLCRMENECQALRNQLANAKMLQKERDMLKRQVGDLECCVADLEDEIKRLVGHIDRLTQGRDEQQTKIQTAMSEIRIELEKKSLIIEKSEEKLATVQIELEKSINGVKSETLCYKAKIEDLEKLLSLEKEKIELLKETLDEKDKAIDELNRTNNQIKKKNEEMMNSENNKLKNLKKDLDNSMKQNEKLQKELEKLVNFKSNESSMKKIILQSRSAIKRVREEIDRQYKEWEMGSGENCQRVEELEQIIKTLESEISQMKQINNELKGALDNQKTCNCLAGLENKSLKKHSTEIQNMAKYQVEELLDHLKKAQLRIIELEDMVDEKRGAKLNPETKDSEISCECDKEDLERLTKENEILRQMLMDKGGVDEGTKVQEFITEKGSKMGADQDLLDEIKRLKNEISSLESDKLKLEKENDNLKTKSQYSKTVEAESTPGPTVISNDRELEKLCASQRDEIDKLKKEIESLKKALDEAKKQIGLQAEVSALDIQNLEDSVKDQKNVSDKMRQELEDKIRSLTKEIEDLKRKNKELEDALADMDKIKKQLAECLEKEKNNSKQAQENLQKENQNLKNDAAEIEKLRKQLAECLENEKKINASKTAAEGDLKKENDSLKKALEDMEKIKKQLTECLEKEKSDSAQKKTFGDELKKDYEKLKKEHENLNEELGNLKKKLAECLEDEKNKPKAAATNDNLQKENEELKNKLKELGDVKAELAACLEREKKARGDADDALKKLEAANSGKKDSNILQTKIDQLQKQLNDCLAREKMIGEKESFQSAVQAQPIELDKLETENRKMVQNLDDLKKENEKCQKELERYQKENDKLKSEIDALNKKLAASAKPEVAKEVEKMPDDSEALKNENKKLKNENQKLKNEIEELKKKLASVAKPETAKDSQELEGLKKENKKLKDEIEELKKKIAASSKMEEIKELGKKEQTSVVQPKDSEDLEALRNENKRLKDQIEMLEQQLKKAKDEAAKKEDEEIASVVPDDASKEELLAEIQRLLKTLREQKAECDKTIRSLKDQYDRDVKNVLNSNRKSIDQLQREHTDQLRQLEERHDSTVKILQDELRKSLSSQEIPTRDMPPVKKDKVLSAHTFCVCSEMPVVVPIITTLGADIGVHQMDSPYDRPGRWPKPKPPTDSAINKLLYKAMSLGMEKLTLGELQIIHSELLEATKKIKGKIPTSMMKSTVEDSTALMGRIEELKDNLEKKQKNAKHKAMEQKIQETRNVLEKEKEHNAELKARLMAMEMDSQLMQVDRDLMKQQTNLQEQQIAKLKKTCECKRQIEGEQKKKKHTKRSRRDSFSSDSTEILERRLQTNKRRSTSTPVPYVRSPHHMPSVNPNISSDDNQNNKRERHGACSCSRRSDKNK